MTHIAELSPSTVRHLDNGGTRMDFDDFVRARLHSLIRYATLLTGSRELAEYTVQEALIRAHGKWTRISVMERPEPYVKRIVTNVFLSSTRRRLLRTVELQAGHTDVVRADRPPSHEQTAKRCWQRYPGSLDSSGPYSSCASTKGSPTVRLPKFWAAESAPSADTASEPWLRYASN